MRDESKVTSETRHGSRRRKEQGGVAGGDKYFEQGKAFQLHQETSTRKSIKAL